MKKNNLYNLKMMVERKGSQYLKSLFTAVLTLFCCCLLAQPDTLIFNYTGAPQSWTVPDGTDQVTIIAAGAKGGDGQGGVSGGLGFRVKGYIDVVPGDVLNIYVGGMGSSTNSGILQGGGWNGGGNTTGIPGGLRGGGGGASDVRLNGTSIADRIIVAAGGGGSCDFVSQGGDGGGDNGEDGSTYTTGGSQTSGGTTDICGEGALFQGGSSFEGFACAGGGGGYYGGAAGCGGGGGSSYIGGVINGEYLNGLRNGHGVVLLSFQQQYINDHCENPIPLECGDVVFGTTTDANPDNPPCRGISGTGGGVWYSFVGTGEEVTVSTCLPGTNYDTYLSVYSANCSEPLCTASNDDSTDCADSGKSEVSFFAATGGFYRILVDGLNGAEGDFQLSLMCGLPCENAILIGCTDEVSANTENMLIGDAPSCITLPTGYGTWYKYEGTGLCINLRTCWGSYGQATDFDTQITVYEGSCTNLSCVAYNDDSEDCLSSNAHPGSSEVSVSTVAGVDYYILVHGKNYDSGTFYMYLHCQYDDIFSVYCPGPDTLACGEPIPPAIDNYQDFIDAGGLIYADACGGGPYTFFTTDETYGNCLEEGQLSLVRTYYVTDESKGETLSCEQYFYCGYARPEMSISCPPEFEVACGDELPPLATTVEEFEAIGGILTVTGCSEDNFSLSSAILAESDCTYDADIREVREYEITNQTTGERVWCNHVILCAEQEPLVVPCPPDITLDCTDDIPPMATNIYEYIDIAGPITGSICNGAELDEAYYFTYEEDIEGDECDGTIVLRAYWVESNISEESEYCVQRIYIPPVGIPELTTQPPVEIECVEDLQTMFIFGFMNISFPEGTCSGNSSVIHSELPTNPYLNCLNDPIEIEFTYAGECGIVVTAIQEFIISNDGIQVEYAPDVVVECLDDIQISPADVTVSTPCGMPDPVISTTEPELIQGNGYNCNGTVYRVIYSHDDACDNVYSHQRFFTIENEGTQVIVAPDQEVECAEDIEVSEDDIIISSPCGLDFTVELDGPQVSDPLRPNCSGTTYTYIYYFTDECGDYHEYYRTFTIQNKELELIPTDSDLEGIKDGDIVMIQCQSNTQGWSLPQYDANSFDFETACNLEGEIEYIFEDLGAANCMWEGYAHAYAYSWNVTDECGSSASFSFELRVVDEIDPVLQGVPEDMTLECTEELPLPPTITATDECECADVFYAEEELTSGICSGTRIFVRTWTAKDCCGNEVSQSQRITIEDRTAPEVTYNGILAEEIRTTGGTLLDCADLEHENWLFSLNENSIEVIETCSEDFTVVYTLSGYTPPSCAEADYKDEWEPKWIVTDDCGNSTTFSFIVRIEDNTAPYLLKSEELYLCEGTQEGYAWVEDECSNALWSSTDELVAGCAEGIYYRIYEMEDACGNKSTDQQLVIDLSKKPKLIEFVEAIELPLVVNCGTGNSKVDQFSKSSVTSISDCIPNLEITYKERRAEQPCQDGTAEMEYIWIATTPCGYQDSLVLKASMIDEEPPTFENVQDTVFINCSDQMPTIEAHDACSSVTLDIHTRTLDWGCVSDHAMERIITATDACGNSSQTTQMVYVVDKEGPVFQDETMICTSELKEQVTAIDECSGESIDAELIRSDRKFCGNQVVLVNTYSATDACGNTTEFTQKVYPDDFEISILVLNENLKDLDVRTPIRVNESEFGQYTFIYGLNENSVVAETPCQEILIGGFESSVRFIEDCEDGINRIYTITWSFKKGCAQEESFDLEIQVVNDEAYGVELEEAGPIYCSDEIPELIISNKVEEFIYEVSIEDQRDEWGEGQIIRTVSVVDNCGRESMAKQIIEYYQFNDLACEIEGDFAPGCNTQDNFYYVNISGGTAPYTIEWQANGGNCSIEWADGETANINIGFGQANILARVIDANGCETMCDAEISCLGMIQAHLDQQASLESDETLQEVQTTTVNTSETIDKVNVYPNPFSEELHIEISEDVEIRKIEVIDTQRKVVATKRIDFHENEIVLNLNQLNSGVYFILLSTKDNVITKKVIRL